MLRNILSLFILPMLIITTSPLPGKDQITIKFSEIENWISVKSPELNISGSERELREVEGYLDSGLQLTNPEISFSNESLRSGEISDGEQEIELSKSFEMPWIYSLKRKGWQYHKLALELSAENFRREFLGRMQSGYVELVLLNNKVAEYEKIGETLNRLLDTTEGKEREGFVSSMNLRMIELAISNLKIITLELLIELEEKEKGWKQSAGIDQKSKLELATNIDYIPVRLHPEKKLTDLYRSSPGFKMWKAGEKEIMEKISAEKLGFLPEITLAAGYKKVTDGMKGMTFGVSFGLPILNRNSILVKKRKLEKELHKNRSEWAVRTAYREIDAGSRTIKKYKVLLDSIKEPPVFPSKEIAPLLDAYKEGTISVSDLISGIQLHLEGMGNFHSALNHYYSNIFNLESKTGEKIIVFN